MNFISEDIPEFGSHDRFKSRPEQSFVSGVISAQICETYFIPTNDFELSIYHSFVFSLLLVSGFLISFRLPSEFPLKAI